MYYLYILQSKTRNLLYKGISNNVQRRLSEHNSNKNIGTRGKGPWELVYVEECSSLLDARKREKYFKSGTGRQELREILDLRE